MNAPGPRPRVAVLISGRGSNLQAIIDAASSGALEVTIALVLSNRADAPGLARAQDAGLDTLVLRPRDYADRDSYDRAIVAELRARDVGLVCLAGFMRLIGPPLLDAFPSRILNIHPSLLPAFRGLDAQKQALDHGVRISGATVHLVTAELDGGPIVMQAAVPVLPDDTVDTLAARILLEEHRIYPRAIATVLGVPSRPSPDLESPAVEALVAAIPFGPTDAIQVVVLRGGERDVTRAIRQRFAGASFKTLGEQFDVASLDWWDVLFGADLVVAPFVVKNLSDARTQYLYKAIADRASPRGGVLIIDRVDSRDSVLLHHLIWLKHAGFAHVDCSWQVDRVAVFGGFTPRRAAASESPPRVGN